MNACKEDFKVHPQRIIYIWTDFKQRSDDFKAHSVDFKVHPENNLSVNKDVKAHSDDFKAHSEYFKVHPLRIIFIGGGGTPNSKEIQSKLDQQTRSCISFSSNMKEKVKLQHWAKYN